MGSSFPTVRIPDRVKGHHVTVKNHLITHADTSISR
jgi:hypothetical protein